MPSTLLEFPVPLLELTPEQLRQEAEIVTDTEEAVDNPQCERKQHLTPDVLHTSWRPCHPDRPQEPRKFWAASDVGVFITFDHFRLPDSFVAYDIDPPGGSRKAFFHWLYKKAPEVVFENVSNKEGGELDERADFYEAAGVENYIVFDPDRQLGGEDVYVFVRKKGKFVRSNQMYVPALRLWLTVWKGVYMALESRYLRFCDADGVLLPTASELAARNADERDRAAAERDRAAAERDSAAAERDRLAAKLRALGIDPNQP